MSSPNQPRVGLSLSFRPTLGAFYVLVLGTIASAQAANVTRVDMMSLENCRIGDTYDSTTMTKCGTLFTYSESGVEKKLTPSGHGAGLRLKTQIISNHADVSTASALAVAASYK